MWIDSGRGKDIAFKRIALLDSLIFSFSLFPLFFSIVISKVTQRVISIPQKLFPFVVLVALAVGLEARRIERQAPPLSTGRK